MDLPKDLDETSFSFGDLSGLDRWGTFSPLFSVTVIGTPTYVGRYRIVGRKVEFQATLVATTSIATVAGTDYMTLPVTAHGIAGMATMTNDTTNIAVGVCHIDVATSRCWLPSQVASGNTFTVAGWFER